jgi:uncharacterized protein
MNITKQDVYNIIPKHVIYELLNNFQLDIQYGIHGFEHWARVVHNGLLIAEHNNASANVIITFGFFHDSCRQNDSYDPLHGERAASLLLDYKEQLNLTNDEINKVIIACHGHTNETHIDNIDVSTCWDADRLELYRVGITPNPEFLNNEFSKNNDTIERACERSENEFIPTWADDIISELL